MTLRERIHEATPVGRMFTCNQLVDELFPDDAESQRYGHRTKIAAIVRKESETLGTYRAVSNESARGRPIVWIRVRE